MTKKKEKIPAKQITKEIVTDFLQTNYGLTGITLEFNSGGTESGIWVVSINDRQAYILKIFAKENSIKEVTDEAILYEYLNKKGVRCPIVVPTNKGKLATTINSFSAVLMKYEELRQVNPGDITEKEMVVIGRQTAILHQLLRKYQGVIDPVKSPIFGSVIDSVKGCINSQDFTKKQMGDFTRIDMQMVGWLAEHGLPNLNQQLIHGDLMLGHTQFLPDGRIYYFDFTDRKVGTITEELGTMFTVFYQWEDVTFKKYEQLVDWFLRGYQQVNPLTKTERESIRWFEVARILGATNYLAILTKNIRSKHFAPWVRRGYELGNYLINSDIINTK